jgi:hypothetical protein
MLEDFTNFSSHLAGVEVKIMPTLEERLHQADMTMVHTIKNGRGELDPLKWFDRATEGARAIRARQLLPI